MRRRFLILTTLLVSMASCASDAASKSSHANNDSVKTEKTTIIMDSMTVNKEDALVDITTSMGVIRIRLYGDTPRHRDNFLKLVADGTYEGTLFHRVINQFMIQAGDPESKNAPAGKMLGSGDLGYTLEAEIVYPKYFHKRGAIAAARTGDNVNPEKRSSSCQFYIVTGNVLNQNQMVQMEKQLENRNMQSIFNGLAAQHRDSIMAMRRNRDQAGLMALQEKLIKETEAIAAANPVKLTEAQKTAYTTVGGAPHLDGDYTVYGEVVSGMDVVAAIEKVATDGNDRPKEDVKIISMKVVEE